ncbi:MAG TPA: FAD-binding oxidoreductase [Candidatus Acidoferrales bacterium]|nr:FAD-binding oxidoreductase [Candidatus Acidoferrales bacterium]
MSLSPEPARNRAEAPAAELAAIVGSGHLRPAEPADAIDGVAPQQVVEPGSAQELAQVLRSANDRGVAVVPRGGGTKLGWGNPPRRADLVLGTSRLNRVREHAWADMTATVEAGCNVAQFQKTLAEHGQRLALDPLWPEHATIGGILATNDSGSLRVRFGALRDLIIGITIALPDGTLAKSGGKVVKNVAGFDLPKLATGSLGTLGVISEAVFRLYPLPRETRGTSFTADSVETLNKLVLAIQDSRLAFTGLQLRAQSDATPQLDVRFEGTPAGIDSQLGQLIRLASTAKQAESPGDVWSAREELWGGADATLIAKFSVLPSQLSAACHLFAPTAAALGFTWRVVAQANGLGFVRLDAPAEKSENAFPHAVARIRGELEQLGGSLVVLHCPAGIKPQLDVWGSPGDALSLMRRLKEELDPVGILNPGRFVGGI